MLTVKVVKNMKGKIIKSLLISTTLTAIILTGCGSKDTESEIESEITTEIETATIEETTTESETTTTEGETSTIEETSTESETTTEVETSTTEDTKTSDTASIDNDFSGVNSGGSDSVLTDEDIMAIDQDDTSSTENITSNDNSNSSTSDSDDAVTRRANYKSKYYTNYNTEENYKIFSWLDDDGDGVITDEEAAYLEDDLEKSFSEVDAKYGLDKSSSSSDSSASSSSSSSATIGTPFDDTKTETQDISTIDMTGASTNGYAY
jgi:hypothetical protein